MNFRGSIMKDSDKTERGATHELGRTKVGGIRGVPCTQVDSI